MSDNTADSTANNADDVLADQHQAVGGGYDPMPLEGQIDTSKNWMGIVALVTGIVGLSLVAIVFGILGLSAVRKGQANNKGMSVTGIVLAVIWAIASAALGVWVVLAMQDSSDSLINAKPGDCYSSTQTAADSFTPADVTIGVCGTDTNAEVYYVTTYTGEATPGDDAFLDEMWAECTSEEALAVVDVDLASSYLVEYYASDDSAWNGGNHVIVCGLSSPTGIDPAAITVS